MTYDCNNCFVLILIKESSSVNKDNSSQSSSNLFNDSDKDPDYNVACHVWATVSM